MISTVEVKTDDLDGTVSHQATKTPVETVEFSLDGERYAIDLTARNAKAFRAIFAQYIPHAQRVRAAVQPSLNGHLNGHKRVRRDPQSPAIRAWAKTHGYPDLGESGRIPADAVTRYRAERGK
jgi:hypothetical protein